MFNLADLIDIHCFPLSGPPWRGRGRNAMSGGVSSAVRGTSKLGNATATAATCSHYLSISYAHFGGEGKRKI